VNAYSRTHDVPNLFLVDGSNFVTSGGSNLRRLSRPWLTVPRIMPSGPRDAAI